MIPPPVFSHVPSWLGAYHPGQLTPNHPHFHYYLAPQDDNQPVTLYLAADDQPPRPLRMFYNIDAAESSPLLEPDASALKDFSYLDSAEKEEQERITVNREAVTHDSSWVVKYEPVTFFDLLTDELVNRNVLTWLKSWDQIVFHKKAKKAESVPALFKKGGYKGAFAGFQQDFSYRKLILLAGPPGCGKTTLARVLARHCGYSCEEINASDDRSGKSLISKIDNLVSNMTIRKDQKPTCIVIDEVDGALDSDSNGLKEVLHYLETGHVGAEARREKAEKGVSKGREGKEATKFSKDKYAKAPKVEKKEESKPSEERKTKIDRPIIFICNDPFVKGLK
jgi:nucleoside-triphosphatase THEP1